MIYFVNVICILVSSSIAANAFKRGNSILGKFNVYAVGLNIVALGMWIFH